jgi:hypothetical protein
MRVRDLTRCEDNRNESLTSKGEKEKLFAGIEEKP